MEGGVQGRDARTIEKQMATLRIAADQEFLVKNRPFSSSHHHQAQRGMSEGQRDAS
jgi:hypothetical protein